MCLLTFNQEAKDPVNLEVTIKGFGDNNSLETTLNLIDQQHELEQQFVLYREGCKRVAFSGVIPKLSFYKVSSLVDKIYEFDRESLNA